MLHSLCNKFFTLRDVVDEDAASSNAALSFR